MFFVVCVVLMFVVRNYVGNGANSIFNSRVKSVMPLEMELCCCNEFYVLLFETIFGIIVLRVMIF